MTRRLTSTLATAAAVLALAACGGEEEGSGDGGAGSEEDVVATWADFRSALGEQDTAACDHLSESLRAEGELSRQFGLPASAAATCEELVADPEATSALTSGIGEELEEAELDGQTATGTADDATPTFAVEDGEWKVTSIFGVPAEADPLESP